MNVTSTTTTPTSIFNDPLLYLHPAEREFFTNCSIVDPNSTYYHENNCSLFLLPLPGQTGPSQPWWIQIIVQILYGIVCCIGLCGNSLVIYVVVRFSKMQTVTNLYIVNLAIADECFLVGIPFLMTTIGLGYWPFGNIVCKAYFTSTSINQITSSMFLLIMSADRYLAVCHPISAPKYRTPLIAKIVALTAWTLSALIMVPIYMYANTLEIDNKINCNIFWPSSETWTGESIFIVYSFIISFAVPLTLIMIFYVLVILKLRTVGPKRPKQNPVPPSATGPTTISGDKRKHSGIEGDHSNQGPQIQNHMTPQQASRARDRKRSHRKVTKLVLTVITVYFICWAPYWITQMVLIYMPQDSTHSDTMLTLFLLAGCFSYSNSTMNPILYAFLSDNFKKSFLKACTCAKGQDMNAQLHAENSMFPRGKKGEAKGAKGGGQSGGGRKGIPPGTSGGPTSGAQTGGTQGTGNSQGASSAIHNATATTSASTTIVNLPPGGLLGGVKSLLQVPPEVTPGKLHSCNNYDDEEEEEEESGVESEFDDEGAAMLGPAGNGSTKGLTVISNNLKPNMNMITPTTSGIHSTDNTFMTQDGVHVTAL